MALTQVSRGLLSTSIVDNGNATAITIDSSENVGIGTSSPSDLLTLGTNSTGGNLSLNSSSYASNGLARFFGTDGNEKLQIGSLSATSAYLYTPASTDLAFFAGAAERMRIDSSGRVLIGTDSGDAFNGASTLRLQNTAATNYIQMKGTTTSTLGLLFGDTDDDYTGGLQYLNSIDALTFNTNNSERIRVTTSGRALIGATSSSNTSGEGVKIFPGPTDTSVAIVGSASTSSNSGLRLYSTGASAYRFYVSYAGQIYATSTSITAISDESLKENIRDLDKGLDTIKALKPRRFDWKNGDGDDIMGFVAQEVQEVLPELVHEYKLNDTETKLGLKMGDMVPSLVKAVQEQQDLIEALTARIAALEGE